MRSAPPTDRRRPAMLLLGIAAAAGLGGCGEPTGVIEGRVTDAGRPIPLARIALQPIEEPHTGKPGRAFLGETLSDGRYFMETLAREGMPVGRYRAIITYHVLPNGKTLPGGEKGATMISDGRTIRRRVALEIEVQEGHTNLDFDVSKGELLKEANEWGAETE